MKLFNFLVVPVVSARAIDTQQVPVLGDVVTSTTHEDDTPPAIGVHFTSSYAIAAARYQNGTIRDLARVEGNAEYIEFMSQWTDPGHAVPMKQYTTVLADFMKTTCSVLEAEVGARITEIAPTFPRLPAWGEGGIRAALVSAGLTSYRDRVVMDAPSYDEFSAADAGVAQRLRSIANGRMSQKKSASHHDVLYVNFDNSSFSIGAMSLQNTNEEREMLRYDMNTQLGWWNLPIYDVPRAKFWSRIHEMILNVLEPMPRPPNRIVLMGDHGADEEMKEVVTAAVWEKYEFDVELMLSAVKKEDAGRLAARGAAELAWRDYAESRKREAIRQKEGGIEL